MRVTQRILNNETQYSLQRNLASIMASQEQISRGTRINRPSDDPSGFSLTLALQSNLHLNKQYQRNITNGLGWLEQTDIGINNAVTILQDARVLTDQGANGTWTADDLATMARQIDAMLDQMVGVANTSLGGQYIFAGMKNNVTPFYRIGDDIVFVGDDRSVLRAIAPGGDYAVNINGQKYFYDDLVDILKGAGSTVDTVDISAENAQVSSFGPVSDALLAATPLNGKMVVNIDGINYEVAFNNVDNVNDMLDKINSAFDSPEIGEAFIDNGQLVIKSNSSNAGNFVRVDSLDAGLAVLNLLPEFNSLQFGEYKVSTLDGAVAADSKAVVTDYYAQIRNTIVGNVGVVGADNQYNSSILMEVTNVNYTHEYAEITSLAPLNINPGDLSDGSQLTLKIDEREYLIRFSGVNNNQDVVEQINSTLGTLGTAYLDGNNNLVLRSATKGQSSQVEVVQIDGNLTAPLGLSLNQSGGMGIEEVTVKFTYHTYDKDGNRYDGCVSQTFYDTDPKDGDPDSPATVLIGDGNGTHDFDLSINLTRNVTAGDKAVISISAQAIADDDSVSVGYDGKERKWVFNDGAVDTSAALKFFTLDEGNGEAYDGGIDLTFTGGIADSREAVTFTAGNMFDCLLYLRKKLDNNEQEKVIKCLDYLDEKSNLLLQEWVKVGARTNHLTAVDSNYNSYEVNLNDMMSRYYSTDYYKASIELYEKELTFNASLAAAAQIMQTSLLNYL